MIEIFYSDNGYIWYWGVYSKEDIGLLRLSGWRVMKATKRNWNRLV